MKIVNNIIQSNYRLSTFEYAPNLFIIRNVLKNKLKCDNITIENATGVVKVYWTKE